MDSWITQELRRIILTKIDEIKLVYFLNKTQLAFIDENGSTEIKATKRHPPWYVTINNSMHFVWRICFLSTDQMHNKALWTSVLFKHGSWCVSFTCLSFCSCKMTSQTVEEQTLTNKLSLVPFLFLYFSFVLQFILLLFLFFLFLFSPSAFVDPYWLVLVS